MKVGVPIGVNTVKPDAWLPGFRSWDVPVARNARPRAEPRRRISRRIVSSQRTRYQCLSEHIAAGRDALGRLHAWGTSIGNLLNVDGDVVAAFSR